MKRFTNVQIGRWMSGWLLLLGVGCGGLVEVGRRPVSGGLPASVGLKVYCAAVMQPLIGQLAQQYERETGVPVSVQFGGSNTLLSQLRISRTGDLFIAADEHYLRIARQEGLAGPGQDIMEIRPVAVVRRDRADAPVSLEGICDDALRVAIANPNTSAIGRSTQAWLAAESKQDLVEQQIHRNGVMLSTVGAVASAVQIRSADVGIVWDLIAESFDLRVAFRPGDQIPSSKIQVAVLGCSEQRIEARQFATYVTDHFARHPLGR